MSDIENDIQILETLQKNLNNEPNKPNSLSQLDQVEKSLTRFVDDSFDIARAEFEFQKAIQSEIVANRLKTMNDNQIIALISNTGVNSADKIAKTMNPWVQLATARQQAQIAADAAERTAAIQTGQPISVISGGSLKELNQNAPKEVLQGMDALSKFISVVTESAKKQIEEEKEEKKEDKVLPLV